MRFLPAGARYPGTISALCAAVILAGCSDKAPLPQAGATEVGVVDLTAAAVATSQDLTGRVAATAVSDVRPQVGGVISARLFQEGSVVQAGQPLYQIDDSLYKATLQSAQAQLETAQANLTSVQAKAERYHTLADAEAVSRQDIDDANAAAAAALANVHQAEAAVQTAKVNLGYTQVLAPISGHIGRSSVTQGALVTAAQTTALATIQQLDPVYVDVTEFSAQLRVMRQALAKGSVLPASTFIHLKFDDGSTYPQQGTLEFSEVNVDPETDTVTLRARFPNPQGVLLPGMFVRVEAPQGVVPGAILVPQQGIARDPKGLATALVVGPDSKVVQRQVAISQAIGNRWLVIAGLGAGDRLIVEGNDKVKAGDPVRPTAVRLEN